MAKILIVDDDEDLSACMRIWLQIESHDVEIVATGLEALERLHYERFDIILLDGHLPDLDGIEVSKEFRASGGKTPIIMLTGRASTVSELQQAGINDFMQKPFQSEMLNSKLKDLLSVEKQDR